MGELVTVPGFVLVPDITLEVHPLMRRLDVRGDQILASRIPSGAQLVGGTAHVLESVTGWPMQLIEARVEAPGNTLVETRLIAIYRFLTFTGIVLVRASDAQRFASVRDQIIELLRTARPLFRDTQPAEISELWNVEANS